MGVRENITEGKYKSKIPYSKETRKEWQMDNSRLCHIVFKTDLEQENGIYRATGDRTDHIDALFDKAWSEGHSSGLMEVVYHYEELLELIRKFTNEI